MTINFHDWKNKGSYSNRGVDPAWVKLISTLLPLSSINKAIDIGCGGGIYSRALRDMNIPSVIGVDYSQAMLSEARKQSAFYPSITYQAGSATRTPFGDQHCNLVFARALIHHLDDLQPFVSEAYRLLKKDGVLLIQDRTPEDCFLEGSSTHIRGYFFSRFPKLQKIEVARRYTDESVINQLEAGGFGQIKKYTFWEVRKNYNSKEQLIQDLLERKGRSILHELSNHELQSLASLVHKNLPETNIVEKDRWSLWKGIIAHTN